MIVNRTIYVNSVEPQPMSFRAPMGMETKLNVAFVGQNDAPYGSDLAAQLQLTGRSSARTTTYLMPATDIANGRARAIIPAGAIQDSNGYRLRMVGTLNGEAALLALGTVIPIAAAGLDAVPEDVIDSIDLTFDYNAPVELDVSVWRDAGKGSPYDLSAGTVITAAVYDVKGGIAIAPFTVTVIDENTVRLTLTVEQVNALPANCWWNMVASTASGATTLAEGNVTVAGTVTPPLTETTALYDYQKPDDLNPVGGQIIHGNWTRDLLKVAKTTAGLTDFSATLELIIPGDEILIGATTWSVTEATEEVAWYNFRVTPVAQDAASGTVTVTFRRPP